MKELNKNTLTEAIQKLPTYDPPVDIWNHIEVDLEYQEVAIDVDKLPQHEPPALIWEGIEANLPPQKTNRLRRYWWLGLFVLLVIGASIFSFNQLQKSSTEEIDITTEEVQVIFASEDWESDDEAFEMIMAYCQQAALVCEKPTFQNLKTNLEELNEASSALKNAIGNFSTETILIEQLKEIELQRSDILKEMIAQI